MDAKIPCHAVAKLPEEFYSHHNLFLHLFLYVLFTCNEQLLLQNDAEYKHKQTWSPPPVHLRLLLQPPHIR